MKHCHSNVLQKLEEYNFSNQSTRLQTHTYTETGPQILCNPELSVQCELQYTKNELLKHLYHHLEGQAPMTVQGWLQG